MIPYKLFWVSVNKNSTCLAWHNFKCHTNRLPSTWSKLNHHLNIIQPQRVSRSNKWWEKMKNTSSPGKLFFFFFCLLVCFLNRQNIKPSKDEYWQQDTHEVTKLGPKYSCLEAAYCPNWSIHPSVLSCWMSVLCIVLYMAHFDVVSLSCLSGEIKFSWNHWRKN